MKLMKELVAQLEFANIRQEQTNQSLITIHFKIEEVPYRLHVYGDKFGVFQPFEISHSSDDFCRLCKKEHKKRRICSILDEHTTGIFQQLIQHPSIRLEWLYIPYE